MYSELLMLKVGRVLELLQDEYPTIAMQEAFGDNPFKLLIAVMLSARARDEVTIPTAKKLFERASDPEKMLKIKQEEIERIIRPIGFYRQKAKNIHEISRKIMKGYGGKVPDTRSELVELSGVGRKTANVVLAQYYKQPVIAVDTHVHRISNRLGWVNTEKPEETEQKLYELVPKKYWNLLNRVLVRHGQEICKPINPLCSKCPVEKYCMKVGVS